MPENRPQRMVKEGNMEDWVDPEPLHSAASEGDIARLQELLASGYDVNAFDELGMTPLHYAVQYDHPDAAVFLIQKGANVNAQCERLIGRAPLDNIVGNCSLEMAQILVKAGANPMFKASAITPSAIEKARNRKRGDGPRVLALLLAVAKSQGRI
jgi:ankyrin repeat protein